LFLLVVATVYTLDVTVINECDERIEVLFEGGLRVGDDGRNRTSIEPSESYHRNVSSHYGSITATGISSGNAMRGRTEAVFFNLFGPSFAISIFEGFDYPMKIVTSSGKKITCEKRACFGKFLGLPIPIQTATAPPDGKFDVTFCI
ncbi:hypothetical protein PENTCL1PPCAC_20321, partial [Pristionchus entomophagus]